LRTAAAATLVLSLLLAAGAVAEPGAIDVGGSAGLSYPVGAWGDNIGGGLSARGFALWRVSEGLGAGLGADLAVYGDAEDGDASLTRLAPQLIARGVLRPGAASFEPGLEVGLGMARTGLSASGGSDPASWDPFWRAGIRWGFSLGAGLRGGLGFDFSGVLADVESAESFELCFSVSREVGSISW
jgi:hypothetical protein